MKVLVILNNSLTVYSEFDKISFQGDEKDYKVIIGKKKNNLITII